MTSQSIPEDVWVSILLLLDSPQALYSAITCWRRCNTAFASRKPTILRAVLTNTLAPNCLEVALLIQDLQANPPETHLTPLTWSRVWDVIACVPATSSQNLPYDMSSLTSFSRLQWVIDDFIYDYAGKAIATSYNPRKFGTSGCAFRRLPVWTNSALACVRAKPGTYTPTGRSNLSALAKNRFRFAFYLYQLYHVLFFRNPDKGKREHNHDTRYTYFWRFLSRHQLDAMFSVNYYMDSLHRIVANVSTARKVEKERALRKPCHEELESIPAPDLPDLEPGLPDPESGLPGPEPGSPDPGPGLLSPNYCTADSPPSSMDDDDDDDDDYFFPRLRDDRVYPRLQNESKFPQAVNLEQVIYTFCSRGLVFAHELLCADIFYNALPTPESYCLVASANGSPLSLEFMDPGHDWLNHSRNHYSHSEYLSIIWGDECRALDDDGEKPETYYIREDIGNWQPRNGVDEELWWQKALPFWDRARGAKLPPRDDDGFYDDLSD